MLHLILESKLPPFNREGLSDWLPRLETRQENLSERLQGSQATNALLQDLISEELRLVGDDFH